MNIARSLIVLFLIIPIVLAQIRNEVTDLITPESVNSAISNNQPIPETSLSIPTTFNLPSGVQAVAPALAKVSVSNQDFKAKTLNAVTTKSMTAEKLTGVTTSKDGTTRADTVSSVRQGKLRAKDVKGFVFRTNGDLDLGSFVSYEDDYTTIKDGEGLTKSDSDLLIKKAASYESPKLEVANLEDLLTKGDGSFTLGRADSLRFQNSESTNPQDVQGSIPEAFLGLGRSDGWKDGSFVLKDLKDASINLGPKVKVQSNDSLKVIVGKHTLLLTPLNGSLKITASPDAGSESYLDIESANVSMNGDEQASIDSLSQVQVSNVFGLSCIKLANDSSYRFSDDVLRFIRLSPSVEHKLCIRRDIAQSFPQCEQCTNLDLIAGSLSSQGSLVFERLHNDSFIPFIIPGSPSAYNLSWDDDGVHGLKMVSENITIRVSDWVLQDEGAHRFMSFVPLGVSPWFTVLKSRFPDMTLLSQSNVHKTPIAFH